VLEAAAVKPEPEALPPVTGTRFRLKVQELGAAFRRGRILTSMIDRGAAVVCDLGVIVALGLSLFIVLDAFWMPLGVSTLIYYAGGILLLGNTPGVCLFGPDVGRTESTGITAPQGV
jgi:hypothetical protein